jgi:hypothetical protein
MTLRNVAFSKNQRRREVEGIVPQEIEFCEHGRSFHCQSCEIKHLNHIIEELQEKLENACEHDDTDDGICCTCGRDVGI